MQQAKLLVVLAITIGGDGLAYSGELYQKNGFSITLPEGWTEMPRNVIDSFEMELSKQAPNATQHYDYGFQLKKSENWFEYPYILVQIKNTGRIQENQLEQLENLSLQEEIREKGKKDLGSVMSDIQVGKMYYDKHAKIVWLRIGANVINVGLITGLSGMVPTETGFIQVSGYSLADDFPNYNSTFQSVAMSVTPEPELVYKPKWSDSLPPVVSEIDWGNVAGKALVGAIIFGIIALIVGLRKKK
jgi:hypothetical protein